MKQPPPRNQKSSPVARSALGDADQRLERKKKLASLQARNGIANGLVEIPGPIPDDLAVEIRHIVGRVVEKERQRDEHACVHRISPFEEGLAIETESEKLAQHIADALARSKKATVTRAFDDEGARRILTCRLPGIG